MRTFNTNTYLMINLLRVRVACESNPVCVLLHRSVTASVCEYVSLERAKSKNNIDERHLRIKRNRRRLFPHFTVLRTECAMHELMFSFRLHDRKHTYPS